MLAPIDREKTYIHIVEHTHTAHKFLYTHAHTHLHTRTLTKQQRYVLVSVTDTGHTGYDRLRERADLLWSGFDKCMRVSGYIRDIAGEVSALRVDHCKLCTERVWRRPFCRNANLPIRFLFFKKNIKGARFK